MGARQGLTRVGAPAHCRAHTHTHTNGQFGIHNSPDCISLASGDPGGNALAVKEKFGKAKVITILTTVIKIYRKTFILTTYYRQKPDL